MAGLQLTPQAQLGAAARCGRSARFRPFTQLSRSIVSGPRSRAAGPSTTVARAAETDAPSDAPAEEFEFSFADAKRGNEYSASDIVSALAYYAGESSSPSEYEQEHVANEYGDAGVEDAAFFDDLDNNEAYDDEFVAAGIPEAAPKQRRNNKKEDGAEDAEDSDDIAAAKQAQALREIEEQMVLEAELQESGLDQEAVTGGVAVGPAVWDWMGDVALDEEDDAALSIMARNPARISTQVADVLPSDEQVFADMRTTTLQDIDAETKDTIEFLLDDFDIDGELKAIPDGDDDEELPEVPVLDTKAIDDLLATDLTPLEVDASLLSLADLPAVEDDGLSLSDDVVQQYVADLKAVPGAEMTPDQVKALFGDEPAQLLVIPDEAPITTDDADLKEDADPVLDALDVAELQDDINEVDDVSDFIAELNSLRSLPEATFDVPSPEEIEVLDQYLTASEQFLASEEERKMAISQAVARGELSPEALEDEIEEYVDVEGELLDPVDESVFAEMDDARDPEDNENWQERIIELSRVTKVVKGGKLMGFRCVAIIGNGKGLVGVGCQSGREVSTAVKRALVDAKKAVVRVPLVGAGTIPHRVEAKFHAARCVVVPAADGTGCLAGGSIRSVLELAGVQNVLGKRLGCRSALNNARCAVKALEQLRTLQDVSAARGVPMSRLLLPQ